MTPEAFHLTPQPTMTPQPNPLLAEPNPFLAAPKTSRERAIRTASPTPIAAGISSVPRIRRGVPPDIVGRYQRRYVQKPKDFPDRKTALTAKLESLRDRLSYTALTHESPVSRTPLDRTQYHPVSKAQSVVDWLNCPPPRPVKETPAKGAGDRVQKPGQGRLQYAEMLRLAREKLAVKVHRERRVLDAEALSEGIRKMSV